MSALTVLWIIRLGFGFVGFVFMGVAVALTVTDRRKRKFCTQPVSAKVVAVERSDSLSMDGLRTVSWYPVYEYEIGGHLIQKRSFMGSARQDFYVGQAVHLYVNPENVNEFYCQEERIGLLKGIFLGVGIVLLIVSIGIGAFI